jgi:hypothetical protein
MSQNHANISLEMTRDIDRQEAISKGSVAYDLLHELNKIKETA